MDTLVKELYDTLKEAHDHLCYCGYGDSWERECAEEAKLDEKIEKALKRAEEEGLS